MKLQVPLAVIIIPVLVAIPSVPVHGAAMENQGLLGSSLRMIWGLLIVVAILLVIYLIAKKRLGAIHGGSKGVIKVIEARHLMPKKSLYLVEVRGKEFLIGTGSETIQLIASIGATPEQSSFAELLHKSETGDTA